MNVQQVIRLVDDIKPNAFSDEAKTAWLNEAEGLVQTEVLLLAPEEIIVYSWEEDKETELLVKPPHDKLYWAYLTALIDFANGEYLKYQNTLQMFNSHFGEYMRWYASRYRPADGKPTELGYYLTAYGIAVKHGYEGTEEAWLATLVGPAGRPGEPGPPGPQGAPGSVEFDSLTEEQLALLRGEPGPPGQDGKDGEPGADGFSPVVSITEINGGHRVTITDANGAKTFDVLDGVDGQGGSPGKDGVSPTVTVIAITGGHRVTITDANGTKYFDVMDGKDGSGGGTGGGADGEDGFSPIVTITQIEGGHRITIEDLNGPQSFDVLDGKDGQDGSPGVPGQDGSPGKDGELGADGVSVVSVEQTTTSTEDGGVNIVTVTLSNGSKATFQVKNGSRGSAGVAGSNGTNGQDGYTPVRGTDYWTAADRQQMVSDVLAALPTWEGGSY